MGVRITDLMDSYHDEIVLIPETDLPTTQRTMELTMSKINQNTTKVKRFPKGLIIAAILILIFSITAGAVSYTVWDVAKNDLGITEKLPEYTEFGNETVLPKSTTQETLEIVASATEDTNLETPSYHPYEIPDVPLKDHLVENAEIKLVSTFCSGYDATVYFEVSPVSPEMAEKTKDENQGLDEFAFWEPACFTEFESNECPSYGATLVEYNEATQSALVRIDVFGEHLKDVEEIAFGISWYSQTGNESELQYYGAIEFPLTQADGLFATLDTPITNQFIDHAAGIIESVEVWAGNIIIHCSVTPTNDLCGILGENAIQTICDSYMSYWGNFDPTYQYSELDSQVYYGRSWEVTLNDYLRSAYLTLDDNTTIQISNETNNWLPVAESNVNTGAVGVSIELLSPIDLSHVVGITINDNYYKLQ